METIHHHPAPAEAAGSPPAPASGTETATLNIEGMTCASCSNFVEKALARTPGVQRATVNLASEKATIEYLPGQIDRAGLRAAVEQAGYGVHEPSPTVAANVLASDDELEARKAAAYQNLKRRFGVAVALAVVVMALSMLMLWPAMMSRVSMPVLNYLLLALTLPVLLYSGREFLCRPGTASCTAPPAWTP